MSEITQVNRMLIASNLTVAAVIRDAAMAMKSGPNAADSRDMVIEIFTAILSNLEKQSDMTVQSNNCSYSHLLTDELLRSERS